MRTCYSERVTCYEIARYEDHYGSKDRKCGYRSVLESTLCTATPEMEPSNPFALLFFTYTNEYLRLFVFLVTVSILFKLLNSLFTNTKFQKLALNKSCG